MSSVTVVMDDGRTWLQFGRRPLRQCVPVESGLLLSRDGSYVWLPDSTHMVDPDSSRVGAAMTRTTRMTDRQLDTLRLLADQHEHELCGKTKPGACVSARVVEVLRGHGLARWSLHGAQITDAGLAVLGRIDEQRRRAHVA